MKKYNRLKVGLFVSMSFVVLAGALLWLAGSRFMRPVDSYEIVFDQSVSGLLPGSHVEYQGVTVGKVVRLRLTSEPPPKVIVTIDLKPHTPIREDTYATLMGTMVTNTRWIELKGGTKESPPLPEGGTIPFKPDGMDNLKDNASELSTKVLASVDLIQKEVLTEQNMASLATTIKNLSALSTSLRGTIDGVSTPETRAAVRGLVGDLALAAGDIRRAAATINGMRADASATIADLRKTVENTNKLASQVDLLARHMDTMVSQNQGEMSRLLSNMADAARQLREASSVVRDDPSRLIWGTRLPERKIPDR